MGTVRTIALLLGSGVAIATVAFLFGRRVESEVTKTAVRSAPDAVPAASGRAVATTSSAATHPRPDARSLPAAAADLFTRLRIEQDSRPRHEPTADSVFAAMTRKLGVQIEERLQVAGFVVGARYCDKVRTKKDVHVVVCEYADEASAIQGVAHGENQAVKRRQVYRNKTTTCAVHQADEKQGANEAIEIKKLFEAL